MTGNVHAPCTVTVLRPFADDTLLRRVRGEFGAMPGMRLTFAQAMKYWTLDRRTCEKVLASLVAADFLQIDPTGRYKKCRAAR